jgi:hypothetical protein
MRFLLKIFIILIAVSFFSCKKAKEDKLRGSWKLLPQTAADRADTIIYRFEDNNVLYRSVGDSCPDTGNYQVKDEFFKYYVIIKDLNKYDDANYYIEKINKKILILQCYSPYLRKEFTRNE